MGTKVPMVLIDNGSALNLCPFRTTLKVGLDLETIIPSPLTVRAHNNTSRKVMGTFKAPCKIGLLNTTVEFHPTKAIPFILHQKIRIPWKGGIAMVLGDGEILAPVCGLE